MKLKTSLSAKVLTGALSLGLTMTTLAATSTTGQTQTSTTSAKNLLETLRAAPVGLDVDVDTYTHKKKDLNYIDGFTQDIYPFLSYNITKVDSLRLNPVLTLKNTNRTDASFAYSGTTLRYKRAGILTQEAQGVDMSAEVRLNHFGSSDKNAVDSYGSLSLRANFNKAITTAFSLSSTLRFDQYDNTNNATDLKSARQRKYGVYFTPAYQLTEKLSVSNLFYYAVNMDNDSQTNNYGALEIIPTVSYSFTPRLSASAYWDAVPVAGGTGKTFEKNWAAEAAWGLTLSYNAF